MSADYQPGRWRCLVTGCNPILDAESAQAHRASTEHRVAAWPIRSAEGKRRARQRNRTGYYDRYNVGEKAYAARVESGHLPESSSGGFVSFEDEAVQG